jgi:hypothetical protein
MTQCTKEDFEERGVEQTQTVITTRLCPHIEDEPMNKLKNSKENWTIRNSFSIEILKCGKGQKCVDDKEIDWFLN